MATAGSMSRKEDPAKTIYGVTPGCSSSVEATSWLDAVAPLE
jgi:hypothetical protein